LKRAGAPEVMAAEIDVSDPEMVGTLSRDVFRRFGDLALLMNNAATGGGKPYENPEGWRRVIDVNLMGPLNGIQAFVPAMIDHKRPALVVNTESKQGRCRQPFGHERQQVRLADQAEGDAPLVEIESDPRTGAYYVAPGSDEVRDERGIYAGLGVTPGMHVVL